LALVISGAVLINAPALADNSASISPISVSANPTEGLPITFSLTATNPGLNSNGIDPYEVMLILRPASGPACASSVDDDRLAYWYDANGQPTKNAPVFGYNFAFFEQSGTFPVSVTYTAFTGEPENADNGFAMNWPNEIPAGSYLACAWLENGSAEDANGNPTALAATSRIVSIGRPAYKFSVHGPTRIRIGHYGPINNYNVKALKRAAGTFTARVQTPVYKQRTVSVIIEPRGLRKCPAEISAPLHKIFDRTGNIAIQYFTHGLDSVPYPGSGLSLHHTSASTSYQFRIAEWFEGGAKPGRALVCAAVYDNSNPDQPVVEATAHTSVLVQRARR
jgi:hypothetical protein